MNLYDLKRATETITEKLDTLFKEEIVESLICRFNEMSITPQDISQLNKELKKYKQVESDVKSFGRQIDNMNREDRNAWDFRISDTLVYQVLFDYFCFNGWTKLAEIFAREARFLRLVPPQAVELQQHLQNIANGNLETIEHWILTNRPQSKLIFLIHKAKYLRIVQRCDYVKAVGYAKEHLIQFYSEYSKECHELLGALAFKKISKSPYATLLSSTLEQLKDKFRREFHTYHNHPTHSPLETIVKAGNLALPSVLKFFQISKQNNAAADGIPVTLPPECPRFHSVFICPITKSECSLDNPPIMLKCGHVISREATSALFKGRIHAKVKCPSCPIESTLQQILTIHF